MIEDDEENKEKLKVYSQINSSEIIEKLLNLSEDKRIKYVNVINETIEKNQIKNNKKRGKKR